MNIKKPNGRTTHPSNASLINPNIKSIDTGTDPDNVSKTSLAERVIDDYAITCLPSALRPKNPNNSAELIAYNASGAEKDLQYLNRKLEVVRKTITAGDAYNILGVAENDADVNIGLNTLAPNSSFIINLDKSVTIGEEVYSNGDIAYKDINGYIHLIKAQGSGVFYPKSLVPITSDSTSNSFQLTYAFSSAVPSKASGTIATTEGGTSEFAQEMVATIKGATETFAYNIHEILNPQGRKTVSIKNNIQPIIYCYLKGERIGLDNITISNNVITITNPTNFSISIEVR